MFNFVEQPVKIDNYEYSRMPQEDVRMVGRPEPLMGSFFGFRRRKG